MRMVVFSPRGGGIDASGTRPLRRSSMYSPCSGIGRWGVDDDSAGLLLGLVVGQREQLLGGAQPIAPVHAIVAPCGKRVEQDTAGLGLRGKGAHALDLLSEAGHLGPVVERPLGDADRVSDRRVRSASRSARSTTGRALLLELLPHPLVAYVLEATIVIRRLSQ